MAQITLKGNPITTLGELPAKGTKALDFKLVRNDLSEATLATYAGKRKILNIFPSIDTATCSMSVRKFNAEAAKLNNTVVLCISADLPFAQKRFCGAEGITNVETLSTYRHTFADDYRLVIMNGPLAGLCSRSIVVLDENNIVIHSEQVAETTNEPNYEAAMAALK